MSLASRCAQLQSAISLQAPNSLNGYTALGSNRLKELVLAGQFSNSVYQSSIFETCAPWIIVAVLALVMYLAFLTNAIWMRTCPRKAKGFWSCCRLPGKRKGTAQLMGFGIFFCTATLAGCIAGAILGQPNGDNADKASCALLDFFGKVVNGYPSNNWAGTNKTLAAYQRIRDKIADEIAAINVNFYIDPTDMNLKVTQYQADLDTLYNSRANYNVKSAKVSSVLLLEPSFISQLGPKETAGTFLNSLYTESNNLSSTVLASATGLNTDIPNLKTQAATCQTNATSAASAYQAFSKPLQDIAQSVTGYINDNYQTWKNINTGVLVSCYAAIGITAGIVVAILVHHKIRSQLSVQIAYIGWNILMLWTVVNAVFTAELQIFKKRGVEHCDMFNSIAGDTVSLDNLANQYTSNFSNTLKTCFFAEGDTFRKTDLKDTGILLNQISNYIKQVEPFVINGPGSLEIKAHLTILDMHIQGLILASNDSTNLESPRTNLDLMNSWADYTANNSKQSGLSQCSVSKDTWVFNLTNCTTTPFSPAYQPSDFFGQSMCLSILSLDSGTIGARYKDSNFPGCNIVDSSKIADTLKNQYNALNAHFEDVRIKFGLLKRFYQNNLNFKYNEILRVANNLTQPIQDLNTTFGDLLDYVSGTKNGILMNSNCSFFRNNLLSANTFVCNAATNLEKTLITQGFSVASAVFGCLFIYLYLRKLEGTFRLIENRGDMSELPDLVHSPQAKEMNQFDLSHRGENAPVLHDAEI